MGQRPAFSLPSAYPPPCMRNSRPCGPGRCTEYIFIGWSPSLLDLRLRLLARIQPDQVFPVLGQCERLVAEEDATVRPRACLRYAPARPGPVTGLAGRVTRGDDEIEMTLVRSRHAPYPYRVFVPGT